MLGGVDHHEAGGRLDVGKSLVDQFQRHGVLHGRRKRIVAAGIEHHEPQLARAADGGDHLLQRHRLGFGVLVGRELGVDRHQIIDAADLEAVAGIIDHRPIGLFGLAGEGFSASKNLSRVRSLASVTVWKPSVLQRVGDQFGVARRIVERDARSCRRHCRSPARCGDRRSPAGRLRRQRGQPLARGLARHRDIDIVEWRQREAPPNDSRRAPAPDRAASRKTGRGRAWARTLLGLRPSTKL